MRPSGGGGGWGQGQRVQVGRGEGERLERAERGVGCSRKEVRRERRSGKGIRRGGEGEGGREISRKGEKWGRREPRRMDTGHPQERDRQPQEGTGRRAQGPQEAQGCRLPGSVLGGSSVVFCVWLELLLRDGPPGSRASFHFLLGLP